MNNKERLRYDILHPIENGTSTFWQKVGVLFPHESGVLTGELYATPLNGRLVVKPVRPTEEEDKK